LIKRSESLFGVFPVDPRPQGQELIPIKPFPRGFSIPSSAPFGDSRDPQLFL